MTAHVSPPSFFAHMTLPADFKWLNNWQMPLSRSNRNLVHETRNPTLDTVEGGNVSTRIALDT